ncbi:MAG: recombinase family protein [Anaerolineae bacterium]|nr:recombinase family protein [Anaerolineae bacterium]
MPRKLRAAVYARDYPKGARAAIYTRVSSAELQLEGYSLEAQQTACERLAQERGWEVTARYTDPGASARTADRPAFQQLLEDARSGRFDVIIVHKLDRFSRSVVDVLLTLQELEKLGVALVSATEQFDFTTPTGRTVLTMLAAFAQWYLDNLAAEVSKGLQMRAESGMWVGEVPFGYRVTFKKDGGDGIPIPDEWEASGVRLAFEKYATGQYSDADIARILNEAGYRPRGRGQRALPLFGKDAVTLMLRNRFYIGEIQYRRQWYPGLHEPIISRELFERVQKVREQRRGKIGVTARKTSRTYILAGLARCARCGWPMRGSASSGKRYYRDPAHDQSRDCDQRLVGADAAEEALGAFLRQLALPPDWREQVLAIVQDQAGKPVHEIRLERERIEGQLERLKRLFILGDIGEAEYRLERDRLKVQLEALDPPRMPDLAKAAELLEDFGRIWDAATPEERRQIVRTLLAKVYLDADRGPVVAIEPKPEYEALFRLAEQNIMSPGDLRPVGPAPGNYSPTEQAQGLHSG